MPAVSTSIQDSVGVCQLQQILYFAHKRLVVLFWHGAQAQRLHVQEALTAFMEDVISHMAGYVPLKAIAERILASYASDPFGDFKVCSGNTPMNGLTRGPMATALARAGFVFPVMPIIQHAFMIKKELR